MKTVDVCGLSCPEPVVRTMAATKALAAGEALTVVADTVTARDNIVRTLGQAGYRPEVTVDGDQYRIVIAKS